MSMKINELLELTDPLYMIPQPVPYSSEFIVQNTKVVLQYSDVQKLRHFLFKVIQKSINNEDVQVQVNDEYVHFSCAGLELKVKNSAGF